MSFNRGFTYEHLYLSVANDSDDDDCDFQSDIRDIGDPPLVRGMWYKTRRKASCVVCDDALINSQWESSYPDDFEDSILRSTYSSWIGTTDDSPPLLLPKNRWTKTFSIHHVIRFYPVTER
jgi:hypothetical protein